MTDSYILKKENFIFKINKIEFILKQKPISNKIKKINTLKSKISLSKVNHLIINLFIIILIPLIKVKDQLLITNDSYITFKIKENYNIKLFNPIGINECKNLTLPNIIEFDGTNYTNISFNYEIESNINKERELKLIWTNNNEPKSTDCLFASNYGITEIDLSNFDSSHVTSMNRMFYFCSSLISLNLSNLNTSKVETMDSLFEDCKSLESLDLSKFDTSNTKSMNYMFSFCLELRSLNLSNLNTANVINAHSLFEYCRSLESLDLSNFNISNIKYMSNMFDNCKSCFQVVYH